MPDRQGLVLRHMVVKVVLLVATVLLSAAACSTEADPASGSCQPASQRLWDGERAALTVEVRDGLPASGFHDVNGRYYDLWERQRPRAAAEETSVLLPTTPDGTYEAEVREAPPSGNLVLSVDGRDLYLVPIYCD